jgi:MFS transporter, DHA1 family, multidrug resistance protein
MNADETSVRTHARLVMCQVAVLTAIGPFASDASLPAFREIGTDFAAHQVLVQHTLTLFWAALAFMSLWHGALSDGLGRRRVILFGCAWFLLTSIACALATNIEALLIFRLLQGLAAGVGIVVGRAVIRDLFAGPDAQRRLAWIGMIFALAPVVAPALGGQVQLMWGWRAVFWMLALLGALALAWSWLAFPETLPPARRRAFGPVSLLAAYREVLANRLFLRTAGAVTAGQSALFISVAAAPALLLDHYRLRVSEFHLLMGPMVAGLLLGSLVSSRIAARVRRETQVTCGYAIMFLGVIAEHVLVRIAAQPPVVFLSLFVYAAGLTLVMPALTAQLLDEMPHVAGTVSSCQYFMQACGLAAVSGVVVPCVAGSLQAIVAAKFLLLAASAALWLWAVASRDNDNMEVKVRGETS